MEEDNLYFGYITSNEDKSTLDVGVTGNLVRRMSQLRQKTYANDYKDFIKSDCIHLVYWEGFKSPVEALKWEQKIKSWSDKKKRALVTSCNSDWLFINEEWINRNL